MLEARFFQMFKSLYPLLLTQLYNICRFCLGLLFKIKLSSFFFPEAIIKIFFFPPREEPSLYLEIIGGLLVAGTCLHVPAGRGRVWGGDSVQPHCTCKAQMLRMCKTWLFLRQFQTISKIKLCTMILTLLNIKAIGKIYQ